MKDLTTLDAERVPLTELAPFSFYTDDPKKSGVFKIRTKCSHRWFSVIATTGGGWDHVSVNPWHHTRTPTWDEMCEIKDMFFDEEEECIEYHPKKSEYINLAEHCLHMWRPNTGAELRNPVKELNEFLEKEDKDV